MQPFAHRSSVVVLAALGLMLVASPIWAQGWTPTDIGPAELGVIGASVTASAINNSGQVVGTYTPTANLTQTRAFSWTAAGGIVNLGTLGGTTSGAADVNDLGQVVGSSQTLGGQTHAFLWTAALGMVDLGTLGGAESTATAINKFGVVIGDSVTKSGAWHAFVWTAANGMVDLGTLSGSSSTAVDLNDAGMIVGSSAVKDPVLPMDIATHAFMWTSDTGMVDIGTLGGRDSAAARVNNSGQVAGTSMTSLPPTPFIPTRAFVWTLHDGMQGLPALPGKDSSQAVDINSAGQVVGFSFVAGQLTPKSFSWTPAGGMVDIGTLGGTTAHVAAVNDAGLAVGYSDKPTDVIDSAFAWKPTAGIAEIGNTGMELRRPIAVNNAGGGQIVETFFDDGVLEYHSLLWNSTSPPVTPPTVTTGTGTGVGLHAATLNGTANPNGSATSGWFEYGKTLAYGTATPVQPLGTGSAAVPISGGAIAGLQCNTQYHFRAAASNGGGYSAGADSAFTTSACGVFTDDPLIPGTTTIKIVHITELRTRIDAVRVQIGLAAFAWTDPAISAGSSPIRAVHIQDLRDALAEAYVHLAQTPPSYTDPSLAGATIKAAHISELRTALVAIE